MEFSEVLFRRQSCRQYADRPVERDKLAACIEAGRLSPSSCNSQRWALIGVDDPALCTQIAGFLADPEIKINMFADQIPAYIVMVVHPARRSGPRQDMMLSTLDHTLLDIGVAAHQICLQATDLGLGSVMLGWVRRQELKALLGIPEELDVPILIGVGYPANDSIRGKVRYPAEEIIRWNGYARQEDVGTPKG